MGPKVARVRSKVVPRDTKANVGEREGVDCEVSSAAAPIILVSLPRASSVVAWDSDKVVLVRMEAIEVHVEKHIDPMHIEAALLEDGWTKVKGRQSSPRCQPRSKESSRRKDPQGGADPSITLSGPTTAPSITIEVVSVGVATRNRTHWNSHKVMGNGGVPPPN